MVVMRNTTGKSTSRNTLLTTVLIALFAALSYVVLYIKIPMGEQFVHMGNMVTILAALLIGGWQGGLSGSIGMGLYDIFFYPTSVVKTLILKFGIGLFTGLIARVGHRHPDRSPRKGLAAASAVSLVIGLVLLAGRLFRLGGLADVTPVATVFLLVLGVLLGLLLLASLKTDKLNNEVLFATLGATVGILWSIVGEFLFALVTKMLAGMSFEAAAIAALLKIPASFVNGSFSIFGAVLLYVPLKAALGRARLLPQT